MKLIGALLAGLFIALGFPQAHSQTAAVAVADQARSACLQQKDDARSLIDCLRLLQEPGSSEADRIAAYEQRSTIFDRRGDWAAAAYEAGKALGIRWKDRYPISEFAGARCSNMAQRRYGRQIALTERLLGEQQAPGVLTLQKTKLLAQLGEPALVRAECKALAGAAERICTMYVHVVEDNAEGVVEVVDAARSLGGWPGAEASLLRGMAKYKLKDYDAALVEFDAILAAPHAFDQPCSYFLGVPESVGGDGTHPAPALHAIARYGRAMVKTAQFNLGQARNDLDLVVAEFPEFGEARLARAYAEAMAANFAAAEADRVAALPLLSRRPITGLAVFDAEQVAAMIAEPTEPDWMTFRADILEWVGRKDEAARYRQKAAAAEAPRSVAQPLDLSAQSDDCVGDGAVPGDQRACDAVITSVGAPKQVVAHALAGRAMLKERRADHDGAVADLTQAIGLSPDVAVYYLNRGANQEGRQQIDLALADYNKAIELDGTLFYAYLNRANIYTLQNKNGLAIADYSKAIDLMPDFSTAWANRGDLKSRQNDNAGALADLSRAIELDPKNFFAFAKRGEVHAQTREFQRSIADNTAAIAIDPQRAEPYMNRGYAWENAENFDRALADYAKAAELAPGWANAQAALGNLYSRRKNAPLAMRAFARAIELDPKLALAYGYRGAHLALAGQTDAALADLTKAIDLDPSKPLPFSNRAIVWNEKKQYGRAIADATVAIKLDPRHAISYRNRAFAYLLTNQWTKAVEDYSTALDLGDRQPIAYFNRGVAYERLKDSKRAIADYREALRVDPDYGPSKKALRELGQRL